MAYISPAISPYPSKEEWLAIAKEQLDSFVGGRVRDAVIRIENPTPEIRMGSVPAYLHRRTLTIMVEVEV